MMHRYSIRYWLVLSVLISTFLGSCTKEELDIYKRPETLEPPIYQVLTKRGNFKTLLGIIDKSGYQRTLSSAGYWTFFAPNDDAFNKYFTASGQSLNAMDSTKAREIVQGLLVFNAFDKNRLADYQAPAGWQESRSFRRKTAYYTGFYDEKSFDGNSFKSVATNRQNGGYIVGDNNNKHIAYFTDEYLSARGLTATDYNYFYPNVSYSGFNVMNSKVVTADIFAENGMVHEIDDVPTVQPSIDEYIRNKPEYSVFRNLIEKYAATYGLNDAMTIKYANLTGKGDKVYVKNFNKQASSNKYLTFSPNCENFLKNAENDAQLDMWSIFVPTNDVLTPYINSVLLENYKSLDAMPPGIIIDLINAHLFPSTVWPTKFQNSFNALGEEARFNANANVVEKKILSNALFYGTNKVQESNLFSSVYSKSYLDPKYSMMTRILDMDWKNTILNPRVNYVLFMISDDLFKAAGYDYDISKSVANAANSEWGYTAPGTTTRTSGTSILANLQRIVATSVIYTPNKELDNLSGSGIIDAINGEYIRFEGNKVYSTGTKAAPLTVLSSKTASNGKVYYTNGVLNFAPANTTIADPIGKDLANLAPTLTSDFGYFFEYLKNSTVYTAATNAIANVSEGTFYTLFIPNNAAIQAAVNDGVLPGTGTGATKTPVYNPTSLLDKKKVEDFINYHILNKKAVATDGKESGAMETLLKDGNGDAVNVTVLNSKGSMSLSDAKLRKATVIVNKSNNLSNRAVIHLIDNYLKSN